MHPYILPPHPFHKLEIASPYLGKLKTCSTEEIKPIEVIETLVNVKVGTNKKRKNPTEKWAF